MRIGKPSDLIEASPMSFDDSARRVLCLLEHEEVTAAPLPSGDAERGT